MFLFSSLLLLSVSGLCFIKCFHRFLCLYNVLFENAFLKSFLLCLVIERNSDDTDINSISLIVVNVSFNLYSASSCCFLFFSIGSKCCLKLASLARVLVLPICQ